MLYICRRNYHSFCTVMYRARDSYSNSNASPYHNTYTFLQYTCNFIKPIQMRKIFCCKVISYIYQGYYPWVFKGIFLSSIIVLEIRVSVQLNFSNSGQELYISSQTTAKLSSMTTHVSR